MSAQGSVVVGRLREFGGTIFAEMTELAQRHAAVNLGQGFPDWDGPPRMLEIAREQIAGGNNQYPPGRGIADLRAAIAEDRAARCGQRFDPASEVLVTVESATPARLSCEISSDGVVAEQRRPPGPVTITRCAVNTKLAG